MALSALNWIKEHLRPLAMLFLVSAGYIVKKTAPLAQDELDLLDAIWTVAGFGAVFTPNFSQTKKPKE